MLQPVLLTLALSAAVEAPKTVRVPQGEFRMGDNAGDEDARPAHPVTLGAFEIGAYEVTNEEYARFVKATGHRAPGVHALPSAVTPERADAFRKLAAKFSWTGGAPPPGMEKHPVVLVAFEDAATYAAWLSKQTGATYRLPTEAEWEKAARLGALGTRPWGNDIDPSRANYLVRAEDKEKSSTKPVGSFKPTPGGLYDIIGNAWEWVTDFYAPYPLEAASDPKGPATGAQRIVRGGAWLDNDLALLTLTHRHEAPKDIYSYSIGFRLVQEVKN
ncbi:MAG: formylglycine-generating enzyme family protein [Vicinamibacteria bacterium]